VERDDVLRILADGILSKWAGQVKLERTATALYVTEGGKRIRIAVSDPYHADELPHRRQEVTGCEWCGKPLWEGEDYCPFCDRPRDRES
jgi:rubrerythrin